MIAVIQYKLEMPVSRAQVRRDELGDLVGVPDSFEIPICTSIRGLTIGLASISWINVATVLRHVVVDGGITFVVERLANEPRVDFCRIRWIDDPALECAAVIGDDIFVGDGAPVTIT